jgi:hypothetical protein
METIILEDTVARASSALDNQKSTKGKTHRNQRKEGQRFARANKKHSFSSFDQLISNTFFFVLSDKLSANQSKKRGNA